ncbi:Gfo/Idh/MocA family oxidoreductase [candidate division WOR-3 bacterium]|nr:Gfo/Idh/MocA family oxidoreductase [candidate division WOR-3 bacterium]
MSKVIRVAVVGTGAQAQVAHIPALKASRSVKLAAFCDTDVRKVNQLCQLHGVEKRYVEFDDLKEDPDIDAVVVATPNYLHAPMAVAAMEYGKDVLCELPLGLNAEEARLMVETARRERRRLMPCLCTRLRPDVQSVKRFIAGRELGKLYYCKTGWLQGREAWSATGWRRQTERAGGGAFLSLATALLDSALWLLAPARPKTVTGTAHRRDSRAQVEDTAFAMIHFDTDLLLTVEVGWSLLMEKDFVYLNVFGNSGAALLNPVQIHKEMHGHLVNVTPQMPARGHMRAASKLLIDLWVDSLVSDKPVPVPAEDALLINQVCDAFYQSATSRCGVSVAPAATS